MAGETINPVPLAVVTVETNDKARDAEDQKHKDALARKRDFLALAVKRFQQVVDAESKLREEMNRDREFEQADHWDARARENREADGRPCLTVNRIPQFIKQVGNAMRATRPAIVVHPETLKGSQGVADVYKDIIRYIERVSDSDIVYGTACEHQLIMGRGYFRVLTKYVDDDGFDQDIILRRIPNPFTVYMDPVHVDPVGSDCMFGFIAEDMRNEEVAARYGKDKLDSSRTFSSSHDAGASTWFTGETTRVAEYFYKEVKKEKKVKVEWMSEETGQLVTHTMLASQVPNPLPATFREIGRREVETTTVKWAKITGNDILEGNDDLTEGRVWPGKYIPIVPVIGDEADLDGKLNLRGMVRDARDPARMHSFWMSALTEIIALAPRAPYIGYVGQFKGLERQWSQAHLRNFPYLEVNPASQAGTILPIPQRQQYSPDISAIVSAFQLSDNDLKGIMSMYDPSLGAAGPETSGRQVLALQRQGQIGNSHFTENLSMSIRHAGRIIVDMIPRVLTPERIMRIVGDTGQQRTVAVHNGNMTPEREAELKQNGIKEIYNLNTGHYDVSVTAGASTGTKRQEAVEAMLQLVRMFPQAAPLISDLMVGNMDFPDAPKVAERLRSLVPPHVLNPGPMPPQVAAMLNQLQKAYQELQKQVETDAVKASSNERMKKAELEVRLRTNAIDNFVRLIQTEAQINADSAVQMAQAEIDRAQAMLETLLGGVQPPSAPPAPVAAPPTVDPNAQQPTIQ